LFQRDKVEAPINIALRNIKQGLVCNVDDDNIMHPNYIREIAIIAEKNKTVGIFYQQSLGRTKGTTNRRIRTVDYHKIKPGLIDSAQFTATRDLIGNIIWPFKSLKYQPYFIFAQGDPPPTTPDGDFIQEIYKANPSYFVLIKKTLCYYNYLAPESRNLDFSD